MELIVFLVLLGLGYVFGRLSESRHYRSIVQREQELRDISVVPVKIPPPEYLRHESILVCGSVVISVDYFKTVAASLRNIFGGRVGA